MNDLASRQATLDTLADYYHQRTETQHEALREALSRAPTIDPVKHGKWERHVLKNANVPWGYDCSACGAWFVVGEDTVEKYYYCPNCGAKMERSEE